MWAFLERLLGSSMRCSFPVAEFACSGSRNWIWLRCGVGCGDCRGLFLYSDCSFHLRIEAGAMFDFGWIFWAFRGLLIMGGVRLYPCALDRHVVRAPI